MSKPNEFLVHEAIDARKKLEYFIGQQMRDTLADKFKITLRHFFPKLFKPEPDLLKAINFIETNFEHVEKASPELAVLMRKTVDQFNHVVANGAQQTIIRIKRRLQRHAASKVDAAALPSLTSDYYPSQQEKDAFLMKATILLGREGIPAAQLAEFLQSPIDVQVEGAEKKVRIKLIQRYERCGQKLTLEGTFEKDPLKGAFSIPLKETFLIKKGDGP